jgi:hypothetical protein
MSTAVSGERDAMPANKEKSLQVLNPGKEAFQLYQTLAKQKTPSEEDLARLRKLVVSTPDAWWLALRSMTSVRQQLIEKISNGATRALMLAEGDVLKRQLGYDTAPPLEKLLIDNILVARLRVTYVENYYNQCVVNQSIPLTRAEYWDGLLSSTQARFLRAIETLARVRRLARNTPALQINIANDGGKQVNVQGDVNRQKAATPPETRLGLTA